MLIGSTSRMINGGKTIKTVYWRVATGKTDIEKKLIKHERTITWKTPANITPQTVSANIQFERFGKL